MLTAHHLELAVRDEEQPVLDRSGRDEGGPRGNLDLLEHACDTGKHPVRGICEQIHPAQQRDTFDREQHGPRVRERDTSWAAPRLGGRKHRLHA